LCSADRHTVTLCVMQVLLKKTTTVTVQNCNGTTAIGTQLSKTFKVQSGPVLQIVMSFSSPPPALKLLVDLTASAIGIDSRRIDSLYVQNSRRQTSASAQLDVVTSSMGDARTLQDFSDSMLSTALAKLGVRVLTITTRIVTPLAQANSAASEGIGRDATIGLAVGLGGGVPLILLLGVGYYLYQKTAPEKQAATEKGSGPSDSSDIVMSCSKMFMGDKAPETKHANTEKQAKGSHEGLPSPQAALMFRSVVPTQAHSPMSSTGSDNTSTAPSNGKQSPQSNKSSNAGIHIPVKPMPPQFSHTGGYGRNRNGPSALAPPKVSML
jgi:hypothetical protein